METQPIQIASLGIADSFILVVMALVVFGPRRLATIGRQVGKMMYQFRKISNDFKFQIEEEMRVSEEAERRKLEPLPPTPPSAPSEAAASSEAPVSDEARPEVFPEASHD